MIKTSLILTGILTGIVSLSSCSKCYECTREIEIHSGGQVISTEDEEEVCTADDNVIREKEAEGYDCV